LTEVAEKLGARFVALAHTADDQVETVLFRILRGTGIAGLRGIPTRRALSPSVALVRPMLELRREHVIGYLAELGQDYRTDSTNADSRWTRNWLRNDVLPLLRERYSTDLDSALLRLAAQAGETQEVIDGIVERIAVSAVEVAEGANREGERRCARQVRLNCTLLASEPPLIVREVCKAAWQQAGWPVQAMGFAQWQLLAGMISGRASSTHANLPRNVQARREADVLVLSAVGLP
jgi:tRNA(Ile)-lysidine synthase